MKGITLSPWAVIRTQEGVLEQCRRATPHATERELWTGVILSRITALLADRDPADPDLEKIYQKLESLAEIMKDIHSWDGVLKFVFDLDRELGQNPVDPSGIQDEINRVLKGEMSLTLLKAKVN